CARCPVRSECLDFALRTRQMHGVWGGTTAEERYLLLLEAALIADAASQSA
ncbi:MAG TPA: WhiB family transcriptional regulator, partial [Trebonia sp.]|nr:WhiB family transcriptional regulator [Trebonia sp.]